MIDKAFSHFVKPELIQPTIVSDYPIEIHFLPGDGRRPISAAIQFFIGSDRAPATRSEINDTRRHSARFDHQAQQLEGEPGDAGEAHRSSSGYRRPVASGSASIGW